MRMLSTHTDCDTRAMHMSSIMSLPLQSGICVVVYSLLFNTCTVAHYCITIMLTCTNICPAKWCLTADNIIINWPTSKASRARLNVST